MTMSLLVRLEVVTEFNEAGIAETNAIVKIIGEKLLLSFAQSQLNIIGAASDIGGSDRIFEQDSDQRINRVHSLD